MGIPVAAARGVWNHAAQRRNSTGHGAWRLASRGSAPAARLARDGAEADSETRRCAGVSVQRLAQVPGQPARVQL